jgi:hypothetical protein
MQTGSLETIIGWKSVKTTYVALWDCMEHGYGLGALFVVPFNWAAD